MFHMLLPQLMNLQLLGTKISHFRDHHSSLAAFYHTSIAGQFPHSNSKPGSNYIMTQPHVLCDAVSAGVQQKTPIGNQFQQLIIHSRQQQCQLPHVVQFVSRINAYMSSQVTAE